VSDAVKALADRIAGETEWNPSVAILRDHILRQFTERLDAVCEKHPDQMQHAMAVIIQAVSPELSVGLAASSAAAAWPASSMTLPSPTMAPVAAPASPAAITPTPPSFSLMPPRPALTASFSSRARVRVSVSAIRSPLFGFVPGYLALVPEMRPILELGARYFPRRNAPPFGHVKHRDEYGQARADVGGP
jgi:hypothetical protein